MYDQCEKDMRTRTGKRVAGVPPHQQVVRQPQNNPLVDLHLLLEESRRLGHKINKPINILFAIAFAEIIDLIYLAFPNSEAMLGETQTFNDFSKNAHTYIKYILMLSLLIFRPVETVIDRFLPGGFVSNRLEAMQLLRQKLVSTEEINGQIKSLNQYVNRQKFINSTIVGFSIVVCVYVIILFYQRCISDMNSSLIESIKPITEPIIKKYEEAIACLTKQNQLPKTKNAAFERCNNILLHAFSAAKAYGGEDTTEEMLRKTILIITEHYGDNAIKIMIEELQDKIELIKKYIPKFKIEELNFNIYIRWESLFQELQSKDTIDYFISITTMAMTIYFIGFDVMSFLIGIVSNRNAENKLRYFQDAIANISSNKNWRNASPKSALMNTVFELAIEGKVFQLNDNNEIPRNLYIVYLYRILSANGFNVHTTGDHNILVGYRAISASLADRMTNAFQVKLPEYRNTKAASKNAIATLNDSNHSLELTCLWKVKVDFLSEVPTIYYYLDFDESAIDNYQKLYLNMIKSMPSCMLGIEGKISLVNTEAQSLEDIKKFVQQHQYRSQSASQINSLAFYDAQAIHSAKAVRGGGGGKDQVLSDGNKLELPRSKKNIYPERINFDNGTHFVRDSNEGNAYPMHIAWLAEGMVYATVHPFVYELMRLYATREVIDGTLQTGTTHGRKAAVGKINSAKGLQQKSELYRDVSGQVRESCFIMKFSNNTGIYGRWAVKNQDGKRLVIFDGPCSKRH